MFTSKPTSKIAVTIFALVLGTASLQSHAQSEDQLQTMQTFLKIMDSYYGIIDSTHAIASNNEKAAIIQMQKIQEVYEHLGQKAKAAEVLRSVLKDSRNTTIRNAAYMLLADNLKDTGRSDEALVLLRQGLTENIAAAK
jgi:lipopolysaccharide biosynthesis regulator YciM